MLGAKGDLYAGTLKEGLGTSTADSVGTFGPLSGIFLLIPFILFFNLWSNWGRPSTARCAAPRTSARTSARWAGRWS